MGDARGCKHVMVILMVKNRLILANFGGFATEFQPRPGSHPPNIGQLQYPQNEEKPYNLRFVDPTL